MKKLNIHNYLTGFLLCTFVILTNRVAAQEDSVVKEEVVKLHYFNSNNKLHYILVESLLKTGKKYTPLSSRTVELYLDSNQTENKIAKIVTDENGKAIVPLPPSLKAVWDASGKHVFIAVSTVKGEEKTVELGIVKSRIALDTATADGVRSITVHVDQFVNNSWIVAPDVEMKIGVKRHGGVLSAGDEATYTTDSTGSVTVEYNKDSLPGDQHGNITLVAKTEDHELFGNLITEKNVSWGSAMAPDDSFFNQRTLWTTRFRTPFWLLFIAYTIVIGVWGTLIYLVTQLFKIRKLGRMPEN